MAIRPIAILERENLTTSGSILRQKSVAIDTTSPDFQRILTDLRDTFYASRISVGLSAVQINEPVRMFIINLDKSSREAEMLIINPELISVTGKTKKSRESCMSIPNWRGEVKRKEKIALRFLHPDNSPGELSADDFLARVILHELDHLDGVLFTDHVQDLATLEPIDFFTKDNYPLQSNREPVAPPPISSAK